MEKCDSEEVTKPDEWKTVEMLKKSNLETR